MGFRGVYRVYEGFRVGGFIGFIGVCRVYEGF